MKTPSEPQTASRTDNVARPGVRTRFCGQSARLPSTAAVQRYLCSGSFNFSATSIRSRWIFSHFPRRETSFSASESPAIVFPASVIQTLFAEEASIWAQIAPTTNHMVQALTDKHACKWVKFCQGHENESCRHHQPKIKTCQNGYR